MQEQAKENLMLEEKHLAGQHDQKRHSPKIDPKADEAAAKAREKKKKIITAAAVVGGLTVAAGTAYLMNAVNKEQKRIASNNARERTQSREKILDSNADDILDSLLRSEIMLDKKESEILEEEEAIGAVRRNKRTELDKMRLRQDKLIDLSRPIFRGHQKFESGIDKLLKRRKIRQGWGQMGDDVLKSIIIEIVKHQTGKHDQHTHSGGGVGRMDRDESNADMESFWTGSYRQSPGRGGGSGSSGGGLLARLAEKKKKEQESRKQMGALW